MGGKLPLECRDLAVAIPMLDNAPVVDPEHIKSNGTFFGPVLCRVSDLLMCDDEVTL